ncbi:MAG: single-stranded-DNA-specific exonuclease RecJ [Wenzhouxiangellaceae bacterium]
MIVQQRSIDVEDQLPDSLHPVLRRVLLGRGVALAEQLDHRLARLLPPQFSQFEQAASALAEAIRSQRRIVVVGDFDADGATASALSLRALRAMGARNIGYCVPNRFAFGYGLTAPLVDAMLAEKLAASGDLLVTVDNGISSVAGVAHANALGLQTIVTDHHLPGETLPQAVAIVNPNLPGEQFPSKALAGVGVVFYLLSGVRRLLQDSGWFSATRPLPRMADWLDLVALGTVADMVPLDANNRILVQQGLQRIRADRACAGIKALLHAGGVNHRLCTAQDLGWRVAPRLNAAGRLEDMSVGIECLLCDDQQQADDMATLLDDINQQRRALQQQMQAEADAQIDQLLQQLGPREQLPPALCLFDERWHQGIVGLVAGRIKDRVGRPVLALAPANPEDASAEALLKGSARSVNGIHIRDHLALLDARHPGLMSGFGGHAMAAGLSMPLAHLDAFQQAWQAHASDLALRDEVLFTDGELQPEDISLPLASLLESALPWGQKFPEPLFQGSFRVRDRQLLKGAHVRLQLQPANSRQTIAAIAFNRDIEQFPVDAMVTIGYRLGVNRFRGDTSVQLMVEHVLI